MLDDITKNALGNLEKLSDATKITCRTNEISTFAQQFTSDDTLISIPNDIHTLHTLITGNHRTSTSVTSIDKF